MYCIFLLISYRNPSIIQRESISIIRLPPFRRISPISRINRVVSGIIVFARPAFGLSAERVSIFASRVAVSFVFVCFAAFRFLVSFRTIFLLFTLKFLVKIKDDEATAEPVACMAVFLEGL